jgi:hypothetical protein
VVVTVVVLELQRARKHLEDFCQRRNALAVSGSNWCLRQEGGGTFLLSQAVADTATEVLRLQFAAGRWLLSVPAVGGWRPYPPRPEAQDIESVIDELEQAPIHVHWG